MRISDWSSDVCSSDLVAFYANDVAAVSATMLREARLSEADWLAMLPATGPMARSVLAGRDDLPTGVRRALVAMGSGRSEEHTSELQSLMRISYAVFCLKKKKIETTDNEHTNKRKIHITAEIDK